MAITDTDFIQRTIQNNPWLQYFSTDFINNVVDLVVFQGVSDPGVLIDEIRQTDDYKQRFAGLVQRQAAGLPPMKESEYLEYERSVFAILNSYGITDVFASGGITGSEFRDNVATLVAGNVDVVDFARRIDRGYAQVRESYDQVKTTFENFYGVSPTESDLLTYFLDPSKGVEVLENQIATAQIGGAAMKYGLNITRSRADFLRQYGVTEELAKDGFSEVAREKESLTKLARIHSISPLSDEQIQDYVFHEDTNVAGQRKKIFDTALSEFQAGTTGRFSRTGGLSGLGETRRGGY